MYLFIRRPLKVYWFMNFVFFVKNKKGNREEIRFLKISSEKIEKVFSKWSAKRYILRFLYFSRTSCTLVMSYDNFTFLSTWILYFGLFLILSLNCHFSTCDFAIIKEIVTHQSLSLIKDLVRNISDFLS
jgi:hypothetical protein